jgi:signal transduction histidine kinase/DNA-binding response OmpR family regulator
MPTTLYSLTESLGKIRRPFYAQLLFVALAFAAMAVSGSLYVENMLRNHLRKEATAQLAETRFQINALLLEPATALIVVANTVRAMILRGDSEDRVYEYMQSTVNAFRHKEQGFQCRSLFGYFDAFGKKYLSTSNVWTPPKDYDFTTRPWYRTALTAGNTPALTPIYMNLDWKQHMSTYVQNIFDHKGRRLAIVCLHVPLEHIIDHVAKLRLTKGGYGVLHDEKMNIFYHPDQTAIGKNGRELPGQLASFADEVAAGGDLFARENTNYQGEITVTFSMRLENGWIVYAVTPKDEYYQELYDMRFMLGLLGALLTAAVSVILWSLNLKKEKADARTRIMLDTTPLCTTFWNKEGKIIDCNQEAVKLFALADKQEYLDRFYQLSPEYQPCGRRSDELAKERVNKTLEEGYLRFEWMHQKQNGEPVPCEVTLVRVMHKDNFIVLGYIRDLREFKAMLSEMRRIDVAEAGNRAKSVFLARMSHEIRTPLNAILGIAEIQLQNATLGQEAREAFGRMHTAGYTLLCIINDLLDLSRIEAGKLELTPVRYDLAKLIRDTAQQNILRIDSKPIRLKLETAADLPAELFGDELRIKQILNNLLSNAFKYTHEGVVTLSVSATYGQGKEEPDVTLVCRVSDTGQGMTAEQVSRLFDEYSRFNQEANRDIEGVGLGMNITQHLIHLMNGEILVESAPGKGSTFTVRLPQGSVGPGMLAMQPEAGPQDFCADSAPHMQAAHIAREPMPYGSVLLVDDMEINLYVGTGLLAPYGLSVDTAASGLEAIGKIRDGKVYDVVFMDHMMPDMDGVETTKILREMGYARPIVALTANAVVGQQEMFLASGFDDFVSKPIDSRRLDAVLKRLIRGKQPPEASEAAYRTQRGGPDADEGAPRSSVDPELGRVFALDAEKAATALEAVCAHQFHRDGDMRLFVVNVHAMRSALANIGETELAATAFMLEQAGRKEDLGILTAETPAFLSALWAVIEKTAPGEADGGSGAADEDPAYLREKLLAVQAACATYDKKAAKDALAGLRQKAWSRPTRRQIDIIAGHLLHSDFRAAAGMAERVVRTI